VAKRGCDARRTACRPAQGRLVPRVPPGWVGTARRPAHTASRRVPAPATRSTVNHSCAVRGRSAGVQPADCPTPAARPWCPSENADGGGVDNCTAYQYDAGGDLSAVLPTNGNSLTAQHLAYDGFGRVATATSGRGVTTSYTYDNLDRTTAPRSTP